MHSGEGQDEHQRFAGRGGLQVARSIHFSGGLPVAPTA